MKYFYNKNKKSIWLFIIIFISLFFYDFFLIAHINDLTKIRTLNDIQNLYLLHPYLPLSKIIKGIYPVQYFDKIGLYEVFMTLNYIIGSLSIFEIIFLITILLNIYNYCFNQNYINTLTLWLILSHLIVFIIHIIYSVIKIINCLVYVNVSIITTMSEVRNMTIIALIIYSIILLINLITFSYIAIKQSKKEPIIKGEF